MESVSIAQVYNVAAMPTTLHSWAKINLGLRIGPVRADGFHELATIYQMIALHDFVTVSARPASATSIRVSCDDARVPTDERNTCWKIVAAALDAMGMGAQVEIDIQKKLPVQGGLGAGSGNAAAALIGLERELAGQVRELSQQERLRIAAQTGSDVPLFLLGGTVWGRGRGEQVTALADSPAMACVIAVPDCAVSTPRAFRDWDAAVAARGPALTGAGELATLNELNRKVAEVWGLGGASGVFSEREGLAENSLLALVQTGIENDFETVVFPQQPLLRDLKLALAGPPATPKENQALAAGLSGSGAALFGLYRSGEAAELAANRVRGLKCAALVTRTLPQGRVLSSQLTVVETADAQRTEN
jgi:4-diphosphocytidyl-2-C-methyl-D-erythritol kinase